MLPKDLSGLRAWTETGSCSSILLPVILSSIRQDILEFGEGTHSSWQPEPVHDWPSELSLLGDPVKEALLQLCFTEREIGLREVNWLTWHHTAWTSQGLNLHPPASRACSLLHFSRLSSAPLYLQSLPNSLALMPRRIVSTLQEPKLPHSLQMERNTET